MYKKLLSLLIFSIIGNNLLAENNTYLSSSCQEAVAANLGSNTIPYFEEYTYWYSFTIPEEGKFQITTTSNSWIYIYSGGCDGLTVANSGRLSLTNTSFNPGDEIFITFSTIYNYGNFSWNLEILPFTDGDKCDLPVEAAVGQNPLPITGNSEYWYKFIMPSDGKMNITSTTDSEVTIYSSNCEFLVTEAEGAGNATATNLSEGDEIFIKWISAGQGDFNWDLTVSPMENGDLCSMPSEAIIGSNYLPVTLNSRYWYSFTMPQAGNLFISSSAMKDVVVYILGCNELIMLKEEYQNLSLYNREEGEHFFITWDTEGSGDFNWDLEVTDFQAGDICSNAVTATMGANFAPKAPHWYTFTAPSTNAYTFSSDDGNSFLTVQSQCIGGAILGSNNTSPSHLSYVKLDLEEGQLVYVYWSDTWSNSSVNWNIKVDQEITFDELPQKQFGDENFTLNASSTSDLEIVYTSSNPTVATVEGNLVTVVGVGTTTITATQEGSDSYNAAEEKQQELIVTKGDQIISFEEIEHKEYGAPDFAITATSSSGLALNFTSSNPSIVSIEGNTLSILKPGEVTITANQNGNENYNPALSISKSFTVNKGTPEIILEPIPDKDIHDPSFNVVASTTSGRDVFYEVLNGPVTMSDNIITLNGITGLATIKAFLPENEFYFSKSIEESFLILDPAKADQTITFNAPELKAYGDPSFDLNAVSSSGLNLDYISSNPTVASVTDGKVTINGVGSTSITTSQLGDANNNPAEPVVRTLTIEKATLTVTANNIEKVYGEDIPDLSYGYVGFVNGENASDLLSEPLISTEATKNSNVGVYDILVADGVSHTYSFIYVSGQLSIRKANQTISTEVISQKHSDHIPFKIVASASSNLPLSYDIVSGPAIMEGDIISLTGETGTVTIKITQPGTINYYPITVTEPFEVIPKKENQTITFAAFDEKTYGGAPFDIEASSSSDLSVTFASSNDKVATITGNSITIIGAGTTNITASQKGDLSYNAAQDVVRTLVVKKAPLTLTADDVEIIYGETIPELTFSVEGLVNDETLGDLLTLPNISSSALSNSNAGEYIIEIAGGSSDNYEIITVAGVLSIKKADPAIAITDINEKTTDDVEVPVVFTGDANLPITWSITGPGSFNEDDMVIMLNGEPGTVTITAAFDGDINYNEASISKSFEVIYINYAPSGISLSNNIIDENNQVETAIGTFSTSDQNAGDTHSYIFVDGTGGEDNSSFEIIDDKLFPNLSFDFEKQVTFYIKVKTIDGSGAEYESSFTIEVKDINESPSTLTLTNTTIDENMPVGTVIGELKAEDPDKDDSFIFEVSSVNPYFEIFGNKLQTADVLDFNIQNVYPIRIKVTDAAGSSFEQDFTIEVLKVTSIDREHIAEIVIYPVPASTELFIISNNYSEAQIIDGKGRLIKMMDLDHAKEVHQINISGLTSGIYYLQLRNKGNAHLKKFIVK